MWKTTRDLEQALVEVQSDKCRIQQAHEELLDQLDEQQEENARMSQKLEETLRELSDCQKVIKVMRKEMTEKDDETVEMYLAIEKLQQELYELTTIMQQKDETIISKNAHLHVLQAKLQLSSPVKTSRNIEQLMRTLDSTRSSDV